MLLNLAEEFERAQDDFLKFECVENKLHARPDLCAFLLLDKLTPDTNDMVSYACHDEITLDVDCEALALVATPADILTLVRCGVRLDDDCLCMFV